MLSDSLNVILGLVFVYLAFSLLTSRINESVANLFQWRAQGVSKALVALVGGDAPGPIPRNLRERLASALNRGQSSAVQNPANAPAPTDAVLSAQKVMDHPLVDALEKSVGTKRHISYLPGNTFAAAVIDILASSGPATTSPSPADLADSITAVLERVETDFLTAEGREALARLRVRPTEANVEAFVNALEVGDSANLALASELKQVVPTSLDRIGDSLDELERTNSSTATAIRALIESAGGGVDALRTQLASWFDNQMERVGGAYKRRVQRWLIAYSVMVVLAFNVDGLAIAQNLWRSPVERAAVAEVAVKAAGDDPGAVRGQVDQLTELSLPLGWKISDPTGENAESTQRIPTSLEGILLKLVGLAMSIVAISFGAPFWFDALGRLANVRNAGKPPPTSSA